MNTRPEAPMNGEEAPAASPPRRALADDEILLGAVPYLNVEPLIWRLRRPGADARLVQAVPRKIATLLKTGCIECGIVPVGQLIASGRWPVVPGLAIGCDGPVQSVVLALKTSPAGVRNLLIDCSSMTSALLGQVVLRDQWGAAPEAQLSAKPLLASHDFEKDTHDAFILIGDEALRLDARRFGQVIDLGAAWKSLTGLPFVFAVWALAEDVAPPRANRIAHVLRQAAQEGIAHLSAVCAEAAPRFGFPETRVREYLGHSICYDLGDLQLQAAAEFARRVEAHGLLPATVQLRLLSTQTHAHS